MFDARRQGTESVRSSNAMIRDRRRFIDFPYKIVSIGIYRIREKM